jgi:hypothetical protein
MVEGNSFSFIERNERSHPMNRQDLINRLVARKLQTAGNSKNICWPGKVLCGCYGGTSAAPRQQIPVVNRKS